MDPTAIFSHAHRPVSSRTTLTSSLSVTIMRSERAIQRKFRSHSRRIYPRPRFRPACKLQRLVPCVKVSHIVSVSARVVWCRDDGIQPHTLYAIRNHADPAGTARRRKTRGNPLVDKVEQRARQLPEAACQVHLREVAHDEFHARVLQRGGSMLVGHCQRSANIVDREICFDVGDAQELQWFWSTRTTRIGCSTWAW